MVKFQYGGFHWNRAGYVELENSEAVQALLKKQAAAIAKRADAAMPKNGYAKAKHHEVAGFQGKFAKGKVVYTRTRLAQYQQARHKTLTKSIGGGA